MSCKKSNDTNHKRHEKANYIHTVVAPGRKQDLTQGSLLTSCDGMNEQNERGGNERNEHFDSFAGGDPKREYERENTMIKTMDQLKNGD
jgi:hypothetical protein